LRLSRNSQITTKQITMKKLAGARVLLLLLFTAASVCAADRQMEQVLGGDRFISGGNVVVQQQTAGDLLAAAGELVLHGKVAGDAAIAGGNILLSETIGQNGYVAGGHVTLNSFVGRNARIAGGTVELARQGRIAGNASVAGGDVRLLGDIVGAVSVSGGRVYLNGAIGGDVEASGGQIELGPNAHISGKLRYHSHEALKQDPAAKVSGGIEKTAPLFGLASDDRARAAENAWLWLWRIGLMVLGIVLVSALPKTCLRIANSARERFAHCALLGFTALAVAPVAIVLLAITLVGLPLALLGLLAYIALVIVGYVAAGIAVGDAALTRIDPQRHAVLSWRVGFVAFAILVISLLAAIPGIGIAFSIAALLLGSGSIVSVASESACRA
jgi:hypothetical protein